MQNTQEKADLQNTKVNATKIRKVRADGNKLCTIYGASSAVLIDFMAVF